MKAELTDAYDNYLNTCIALAQKPTVARFGQFLVDSYSDE